MLIKLPGPADNSSERTAILVRLHTRSYFVIMGSVTMIWRRRARREISDVLFILIRQRSQDEHERPVHINQKKRRSHLPAVGIQNSA